VRIIINKLDINTINTFDTRQQSTFTAATLSNCRHFQTKSFCYTEGLVNGKSQNRWL